MTKLKKAISSLLLIALCAAVTIVSVPVVSFAADSFESSLAAFPESYKPYLKALHEKYPKWEFQALKTGLDWTASVNAQYANNNSLVTASTAYTDIFRSREPGDYNADTNTYIQKDAGFVRANKLAISFYMDPRNFLTEEGIFQFEKLSFDSSIKVSDVEAVLKNSFMYNTNITYYGGTVKKSTDSSGKDTYTYKVKSSKITTDEKYSEVIYNAGKTYNVNPCFLASKIIGEVGYSGTNSVSGQQETYPGVYNFYNIGAYDGGNPIEKGLYWASSSGTYAPSTYDRPWTTPQKSIMGGAKFNAETYIAAGQYTAYLQKFNVDPNAKNKVYTHQYMTNLSGVAGPAYSTYLSYKSNKLLSNKFVFSIPVYENMPAQNVTSGTLSMADGQNQTAKTNASCNVRSGPSTENATVGIQLNSGVNVEILETVKTDAKVFDNVMRYPFWSKIRFTSGGKTYTGYVYSNFLTLTTQTVVPKGSYAPVVFKSNKNLEYRYVSSDSSIAQIVNDTAIKFLKTGTVTITAYDSVGRYQAVKYKVVSNSNSAKYDVANIKASNIKYDSVKVSFSKNSDASSYEVYILNANGKCVKSAVTKDTSVTFTGLSSSTKYTAYVRTLDEASSSKTCGVMCGNISFTTAASPNVPAKVTGVSAVRKNYSTVTVKWNASEKAIGYVIYTYNASKNKYTQLATIDASKTSYDDNSENSLNKTSYAVRAYNKEQGETLYSDYSSVYTYKPPEITVGKVKSLTKTDESSKTITLSWNAVKNATSYEIYRYSPAKKSYIKVNTTKNTTYKVKSLNSSTDYKFKVRAVIKVHSKNFYGSYSSVLTAKTSPAAVKKIYQTDVTTSSFYLRWDKVSGATAYRVYIYDSNTKKYKKLKNTTKNYIKVTDLKAGNKITYKVVSYNKTDKYTYYGDMSSPFCASTLPKKPSSVSASDIGKTSLTLSWKSAKGATGYQIYMLNAKTGKYKAYKSTSKTSITLKKLSKNTTYKFKVKAISKTDNVKVYSAETSALSVKTKK